MKFIKENLFLVVLVSVTVLLAAVAVVLERNYSAAAEKGAAARTSLSNELSSLARGAHANQAAVDAEAEKVRLAREAVEKAKEGLIERNRAQYRVMTFVADDKTYPAFPIDKDLYARVGAEYKIAQAYQDEVASLLKRLSPTEAPTSGEIDAAIRPDEQPGLRSGPAAPPRTGSAAGTAALYRTPVSVTGGVPARPGTRGTGTGEENAEPTPEEIAREKFILARALKGRIYASKEESMYLALLSDQVRYNFEELWFAQVSLWVMQDIVEAVKVNNEQASSLGLGVPVSAVKRLVETEVLGYVVGQSGEGASGGAGLSARLTVSGAPGRPGGSSLAAPAGAAAAPASADLQYFTGGARRASSRAPNLTGRACSQLYDVVHYRFTVIMPTRHLPRLCRNLMMQNYHTVIEVHVSATDSKDQRLSGGAETIGRRGKGGDRSYYYGTDSVVEVTIVGELLLLTDWARGRKKQVDLQTGEDVKSYPPLMPKEFLSSLGGQDAQALRAEDLERAGPITSAPKMPGTIRTPSIPRELPSGIGGPGGPGGFGEP